MSDFDVFPTEGGVATVAEDARVFTEPRWRDLWDPDSEDTDSIPLGRRSLVLAKPESGFSSTPSGLSTDIGAGVLVAGGYVIQQTATVNVSLTASSLNFIWLTLPMAGGKVSGQPIYQVETDISTIPLHGILLYILQTDGSSVTTTIDRRPVDSPLWVAGSYNGAADGQLVKVAAGFRPSRIEIQWSSGNSSWANRAYRNISMTFTANHNFSTVAGLVNTPAYKHILFQAYGFSIEGKSSALSTDMLAINGESYEFLAYR